jgi:hypothetical protein
MVNVAKVINIIGSKEAKDISAKAVELLKGKDKKKLKKAEDLVTEEKKKIQIKDQDVDVGQTGVNVKVSKEDLAKKNIKVKEKKTFKKVKEIDELDAQEVLLTYNATKLTPKILADFNIKNMKSEKDILKFIEIISKKYSGDIKSRTRGIQDHPQTKRLATLIGKDQKSLTKVLLRLREGDTLNAEYMLAARELLAAGMGKLDDLAAALTQGGGVNVTDAMRLEFRQHFALMSELQKIIKGVQTETARTLQSMKIPTRTKSYSNIHLDDLNKSDLIIQMGGGNEIDNLATLYLRSGSANAKLKFTQDTGGFLNLKKVSDSIGEIFINSILSAPITHVRNLTGNWIAQGIVQTEKKLAARLYGNVEGSGVAAYEDVAAAYGKAMANSEMFVALSKTFKEQGGVMKIIKNYENLFPATHGGSKVEMHGSKLTAENFNVENKTAAVGIDFLGNILTMGRIPTKMLHASDNFFKNREHRASLFTQAYREAMELYQKNSLKYEDMAAFIAHRVDQPTSNMIEVAKKETLYSVFQTKAADRGDAFGKLALMAQKLKGGGGGYFTWLTNYYIPFTQTPINIAGFVAERTPGLAQILTNYNKKIAAGGIEATMARVKLQLGTAFYMAAIGSTYASKAIRTDGQREDVMALSGADIDIRGVFTGGKHTVKDALGFQANSIRIPDGKGGYHQFNLTGLDPISSMFAMAGNSAKAIEMLMHDSGIDHFFESDSNFHPKFGDKANKKINSLEMAQVTMALILSFGENLTNSTYLQGAGNFFEDIQKASIMMSGDLSQESVKTIGKQWSLRFATGFLPNIAKRTSKTWINSDFKKISNEWNTLIESQFYNKDLPTRYNLFGKPIETFGFYSNIKLSDAQKEVYKIMPKLSRTDKKIRKKDVSFLMTGDEQEFFQYHSGIMFTNNVEQLMKDPDYQNTDVAVKKILLKKALSNARSDAKILLKADGSENFKLSNGTIAPVSKFYKDINARYSEVLLQNFAMENDGDPFKDNALIQLENAVDQQKQIIEANTQ